MEKIVAGVWLWHCHLDRHLSWGMDTVLIVKNGDTPETSIREPPPNMPPCTADSSNIRLRHVGKSHENKVDRIN